MHAIKAMLLAVLQLHLLLLVKISIGRTTVLLLVSHGANGAAIGLATIMMRVVMVWRMVAISSLLHAHNVHATGESRTGHTVLAHAVLVVTTLLTLARLLVVFLAKSVANIQLVLLEHEVLVFDAEHLVGVVLVLVGDEAVAARVAAWVGDDARVLHVAERAEVLAQLVLVGRLRDAAHEDAVRYAVHGVVAVVVVVGVGVVGAVVAVVVVTVAAVAVAAVVAHLTHTLSAIDFKKMKFSKFKIKWISFKLKK